MGRDRRVGAVDQDCSGIYFLNSRFGSPDWRIMDWSVFGVGSSLTR
jgi:hypothetical protein